MIKVRINAEQRELEAGLNVTELLALVGVAQAGVMVEKNGEVINRDRFDEEPVQEGDKLELIRLIGGG